jgi:hypothetical protein
VVLANNQRECCGLDDFVHADAETEILISNVLGASLIYGMDQSMTAQFRTIISSIGHLDSWEYFGSTLTS